LPLSLEVQSTSGNSNLPLTRSNFHYPSDRFLYNFTLDNLNFFLFPLKVRIIGSRMYYIKGNAFSLKGSVFRQRSRRLEVVGKRENGRSRGRHARGVSFFRARFFCVCVDCFQAPAMQANLFQTRGLEKGWDFIRKQSMSQQLCKAGQPGLQG